MNGAKAGDYRAAAGAAQAAHKDELADLFLEQGLQRYPSDAELLRMRGKRAVARGNYKEGQSYLKSALVAARNPQETRQDNSSAANGASEPPALANTDSTSGLLKSCSQMPACRKTTSFKLASDMHVQPVSFTLDDQGAASQTNGNQTNNSTQNNPTQNSENQNNSANPEADAQKQQQIQDE